MKEKNKKQTTEQMTLTLDWSYVFDRKQRGILYSWLDSIPFTRKRGKIEKDFADGGILMFEMLS